MGKKLKPQPMSPRSPRTSDKAAITISRLSDRSPREEAKLGSPSRGLATPRSHYANAAYDALHQEESALSNLRHPKYGDPGKSLSEEDFKMSLPWRRSIISSSEQPQSAEHAGDARQEHVFRNMLEDHAGHLENRCQALEQNCKNIENSRRDFATNLNRTTEKLTLDIKGLQKRNADNEAMASVKEKNHLLEKESLRNDLMKSETEANKALANLKHKQALYASQVALKNKRIDELSTTLESLSSNQVENEKKGIAMRSELEQLRAELEQLQGQKALAQILIADLEAAESRARQSQRKNRTLREDLMAQEAETATRLFQLEEERRLHKDALEKLRQHQRSAELHERRLMAIIWARVVLRELTKNRPALAALRIAIEGVEEKFGKIERLSQSKEPEWKAKLSSDVRQARSRFDDIVADSTELEQQFNVMKMDVYRVWDDPFYLEKLRGAGQKMLNHLEELAHYSEELVFRVGKTRDEVAHIETNLSSLEQHLVHLYAQSARQKIGQLDDVLAAAEDKQNETETKLPLVNAKFRKDCVSVPSTSELNKHMMDIKTTLENCDKNFSDVKAERERLQNKVLFEADIDHRNAQVQNDLQLLSDLQNKRLKEAINRATDNLRETDSIHCNLIDCEQKLETIRNGTAKDLAEKVKQEVAARASDYQTMLSKVRQLESSQANTEKDLADKATKLQTSDELLPSVRELSKEVNGQNLGLAQQKLKKLEASIKQADWDMKKISGKGAVPKLSEVLDAHSSLQQLNQESDSTAGYIQKVCRNFEPLNQEARDLDVRSKLELRNQLQGRLMDAQDSVRELQTKMRESDEVLEKAMILKANIETSAAFTDGEKLTDVNQLAANINRERDELQNIYRIYDKLSHQANDEVRQINVPSDAEITAQPVTYLSAARERTEGMIAELDKYIDQTSSIKRGLQGAEAQALALQKKYERKRAKLQSAKRLHERANALQLKVNTQLSGMRGKLSVVQNLLGQTPRGGLLSAEDKVKVDEFHLQLSRQDEKLRNLEQEGGRCFTRLGKVKTLLNKVPREVVHENQIDDMVDECQDVYSETRRMAVQLRDMEMWTRDAEETLEPVLRTQLGDQFTDTKLLYLHINRGVSSLERKLQEFQESMETFPKDAQELLSQERSDLILKQRVESALATHSKLKPMLQATQRSMSELTNNTRSIGRELSAQDVKGSPSKLHSLRSKLDSMDPKLKDTTVDLNKCLREVETLEGELEKAKISHSIRREKISEMMVGIERITSMIERIHERVPKAQQRLKEQLLLVDAVGLNSGVKDYFHEQLAVETIRENMDEYQIWLKSITNRLVRIESEELHPLIKLKQNSPALKEEEAKGAVQKISVVLEELHRLDEESATFLSEIDLWRDIEADLRIPANLKQRGCELKSISQNIQYALSQNALLNKICNKLQNLLQESPQEETAALLQEIQRVHTVTEGNIKEHGLALDGLKTRLVKLSASAKQHDFAAESIPRCIPFITESASLQTGAEQVGGDLCSSIRQLDDKIRLATETAREASARASASNNNRIRELQEQLAQAERELELLRRKHEFNNLSNSILHPVNLHIRSLDNAKRDVQYGNQKLERLRDIGRARQQQRTGALVSEGQNTHQVVLQLDEEANGLHRRVLPMQRVADVFDGRDPHDNVRDAILALSKHVPAAKLLDSKVKKVEARSSAFREDVDGLETRLLDDLKKELDLRTSSNHQALQKNQDKMQNCNTLADRINDNIADKLTAVSPLSSEADRFNTLRAKLLEKMRLMKSLEKQHYRNQSDNKRIRMKLDDGTERQVESMARLVDSDLVLTTQDIDKNGRGIDSLQEQLRQLLKDYGVAENELARLKLDELEQQLAEKKRKQRDMTDRLNQIERQLGILLNSMEEARKASFDNPELQKALDTLEVLIRDKLAKEHRRCKGEHEKLAQELLGIEKKLDIQRTNPTIAGLNQISLAMRDHDDRFLYLVQDVNTLKERVHQVSIEMTEIHNKFGDLLFNVQRQLKLATDDMRDLMKRLKEIQRVLSEVDSARKNLSHDGFNDAEKKGELEEFARKRELPLLNRLKELNSERDRMNGRLDAFKHRLDVVAKGSSPSKMNLQEVAKLAREARGLDLEIREKEGLANELLSESELCRDDMKQLVVTYEKKAQQYSDTLAEAHEARQRLNVVDDQMENLRTRLVNLTDTISDTPKARGSSQNLLRDQLLRDVENLRLKISDANKTQQTLREDFDLHTRELPSIANLIITYSSLKQKQEALHLLRAKIADFESELHAIDLKLRQVQETAQNEHRKQKSEQLYDVERRAKNQDEELKTVNTKLKKLSGLITDIQRDAENEQRTNPNNPILYDSMSQFMTEVQGVKTRMPGYQKEHSTLRSRVADILNELTLLSPRNINPSTMRTFSDNLDEVEPRTTALHSDVDSYILKLEQLWEELRFAKQDALKRLEKNRRLLNDTHASNQANNGLMNNLRTLRDLIDDMRLIAKAMTHNPDYADEVAEVGSLTNKLNKTENQYDTLVRDQQHLAIKLQELLNNEKSFGVAEDVQIQRWLDIVTEILPLLETYEQQSEELIQGLNKKRNKLGDLRINENIEKRKTENLELQECIHSCENEMRGLTDKLKYHDQFCDLPGQRDDMIRDMVRKDIDKGNQAVAEARMSKDAAMRELQKVQSHLEGRNLITIKGADAHKPILTIAQIGEKLRKTLQNLNDVLLHVVSGKDTLGDLDVEKKLYDMEMELKGLDESALNIQKDLQLLEEVVDALDNDHEDKDEEKLHLVLQHDIENIRMSTNDLHQEVKMMIREFERVRNAMDKARGDNDQMVLLIRELNTLDAKILRSRSKLQEIEKLLGKSKDRVAAVDLDVLQKNRNQQMSVIKLKLTEGKHDMMELRAWADEQASQSNEFQMQIAELETDLKSCEQLYRELEDENGGLQTDLAKIAEVLRQLKKPRSFYQNQPPYVGYKHVGKRIRWIMQRLLQFEKRIDKIKSRKQKILNSRDRIHYRAVKGDPVDRLLADFINSFGCPVPITRIGGGFYMFGTRKIYAKIINGKLVIRVGGGYMNIEEFVAHHANQELMKMQLAQARSIELSQDNAGRRGSGTGTTPTTASSRRSFGRYHHHETGDDHKEGETISHRRMVKSTSAGNVGRISTTTRTAVVSQSDMKKMLKEFEKEMAKAGDQGDYTTLKFGSNPRTPR